jgi:hypothetical protein
VTVCQDVDSGVSWAKVRTATTEALVDLGLKIEVSHEKPDPDTWGTSEAAQAELRLAMGMGGGVGGGPDP